MRARHHDMCHGWQHTRQMAQQAGSGNSARHVLLQRVVAAHDCQHYVGRLTLQQLPRTVQDNTFCSRAALLAAGASGWLSLLNGQCGTEPACKLAWVHLQEVAQLHARNRSTNQW
jgi:hypothetical protein